MKTRLFTRKRALISSVAMLLVAMIALGTATFAWFTKTTAATAKGIKVKTIQASDLQIARHNGTWSTTVNYGITESQILFPTSTADGSTWFATEAEKRDSAAKLKTATVSNVTGEYFNCDTTPTGNVYYFLDHLDIRNNGDATVNDVTISFSIPNTANGGDYLRVAIAEATAHDSYTLKTSAGEGEPTPIAFSSHVYDNKGDAYNAVTGSATVPDTDPVQYSLTTSPITPKTTCSLNVGNFVKDAVRYFNIYIWYEGQDEQCYSDNAGVSLSDMEFTVTGTPVQE